MDYLKKLCDNNGVILIYTDNKTVLLSSGSSRNSPSIRAHKLFKGCPEDIAKAIIDYYIFIETPEISLSRIKDYMNNFYDCNYTIKAPSKKYLELLSYNSLSNSKTNHEIELEIASIKHKDSKGEYSLLQGNQSITIEKDQLIELDITVDTI